MKMVFSSRLSGVGLTGLVRIAVEGPQLCTTEFSEILDEV